MNKLTTTLRKYAPLSVLALCLVLMAGVALLTGPTSPIAPETLMPVAAASAPALPACDEEIETISMGMEGPGCDLTGSQVLVILYMPEDECLDAGGLFVPVGETALCADVDY